MTVLFIAQSAEASALECRVAGTRAGQGQSGEAGRQDEFSYIDSSRQIPPDGGRGAAATLPSGLARVGSRFARNLRARRSDVNTRV